MTDDEVNISFKAIKKNYGDRNKHIIVSATIKDGKLIINDWDYEDI